VEENEEGTVWLGRDEVSRKGKELAIMGEDGMHKARLAEAEARRR
jgi:hypothetical protein